MSLDQVINSESTETNPHHLVPAVAATSVAVDMDLLNSFEELQEEDGSDLIVELIDLYLEDAPLRILAMREAAGTTEWTLLKRAAHNLKGSSANLGVRQVAETCAKLEGIESAPSATMAEILLQQLDREFAAASAALLAERLRRLK